MTEKELSIRYGELISRCWEDEAFKKRFMEDTRTVLEEADIPVKEGVDYQVVEAEPNDRYVVLPDVQVAETVRELAKLLLSVSEQTDIIVPEGSKIVVLQNTAKLHYLVFKQPPHIISEVELDMVVGGKSKNAVETTNYVALVNVAVVTNAAAAQIAAAGVAVAAGGAACVAVAAIIFI